MPEAVPLSPEAAESIQAAVAEVLASDAPTLTVVSGVPAASFVLPDGDVVVGRGSDAGITLRHPEVSRQHCRLSWDPVARTAFVEDLGSRWGTRVNSAALSAHTRAPLAPGDILALGPVVVHFGLGPLPAGQLPAAGAGEPAAERSFTGTEAGPPALLRGTPVDYLPLPAVGGLSFGRGDDNDVVLADPGISRKHLLVERAADGSGWRVTDLRSRVGSLVNGRRFESHGLVIGDQLQAGPFSFRFDGRALERVPTLGGVEVEARHMEKRAGATVILDDVSVHVDRGDFAAILGPSGSGKSSLLDTLTGLRPGQSGQVLFDGSDFYAHYDQLRSLLGYVPQDDIVHAELTVREALTYSARLRLPTGTPFPEIVKLVEQTMHQLGLDARAETPVARLSGGQRKRVSVGVELLGSPAVLFLDEPTSGLDPAAEAKMMELLRHLADGGCTVVCTTHVMENVYLTDRIFVVAAGKLVFAGGVAEAREHFGVAKLPLIYDRLEERPATEWRARLQALPSPPPEADAPPISPEALHVPPRVRPMARRSPLGTLLARQWAILKAERFTRLPWLPMNFAILAGQPLLIALLVAWVSTDAPLSLFFAYLATLWFGTSNAAQEIVRELPIYRRERMVGLGRHGYLVGKFLLFGAVTVAQAVFLYGCLRLFSRAGIGEASAPWVLGGLAGAALAGVGIGFAVSALVRKTMQAVLVVPLILIPQIVFSGSVFPTDEMRPAVWWVTAFFPSYAAQTAIDTGLLWGKKLDGNLANTRFPKAYRNLELLLEPRHKQPDGSLDLYEVPRVLSMGKVVDQVGPGARALLKLLGWTLLGYIAAWFGLRAKERG